MFCLNSFTIIICFIFTEYEAQPLPQLCPYGYHVVIYGTYTGSYAGCYSPYPQVLSKPYGCCPCNVKGYTYTLYPTSSMLCYDAPNNLPGKCCRSFIISSDDVQRGKQMIFGYKLMSKKIAPDCFLPQSSAKKPV